MFIRKALIGAPDTAASVENVTKVLENVNIASDTKPTETTSTEQQSVDNQPTIAKAPETIYDMQIMVLTFVEANLNAKLDNETAKGVREVLKKNTPSKTRVAFVFQRNGDLTNVANVVEAANGSGTISLHIFLSY